MADGFAALGELLGGGVDTSGAYNEGLYEGSRAQKALAEARIKRDEAVARTRLQETLHQNDVQGADVLANVLLGGFGNWQQATAGQLNLQEQGFRDIAGDPEVPFEDRNVALQGLASGPVSRFESVGGSDLYTDIFSGAEAPTVSPLGEAQIGADEALAQDRLASAALDDAKRTDPARFRSGGLTLNVGGEQLPLGDFLEETFPAQDTVPDSLTTKGMEGATGVEGVIRRGANVASDFVGRDELPFPEVDVAQNAMEDLAIKMQTIGQTSIPGRPSNYLMQLLDKRNVNPADVMRGDARALNRFQQTRNTIAGDVERLQNMLNQTAGLTDADISDTRIAFDLMRNLLADFDAVLSVLNPAPEASPASGGWVEGEDGVWRKVP